LPVYIFPKIASTRWTQNSSRNSRLSRSWIYDLNIISNTFLYSIGFVVNRWRRFRLCLMSSHVALLPSTLKYSYVYPLSRKSSCCCLNARFTDPKKLVYAEPIGSSATISSEPGAMLIPLTGDISWYALFWLTNELDELPASSIYTQLLYYDVNLFFRYGLVVNTPFYPDKL